MRLKVSKGVRGQESEQRTQVILIMSAAWQIPGSEKRLHNFVRGFPGFQLSNVPCCWLDMKVWGLAEKQRFHGVFYSLHPHPLPNAHLWDGQWICTRGQTSIVYQHFFHAYFIWHFFLLFFLLFAVIWPLFLVIDDPDNLVERSESPI